MNTEFTEQLIHLAQISRVAVRVEQRQCRSWVPHIHSHNLVPSFCTQLQNIDVFPRRHARHRQSPSGLIHRKSVRWRLRWAERELGGQGGLDPAHYEGCLFREKMWESRVLIFRES